MFFNLMTALAVQTPMDIPLPQPLPRAILVFLLILSFLLHILFVNLMVGGTLLTVWFEWRGRKRVEFLILARAIGDTITVNKSLAVVLGVAPLLTINTLYTVFFYSANSLTGTMWISIVPIVSAAFLLLYWHKYTWEKYRQQPGFHLLLAAVPALLFLLVPLIFLTNINLMLFPHRWEAVRGFLSAMVMANVIPRYFHFLAASLAVTGLFLFAYMRRKSYDESRISPLHKGELLRGWYRLALYASGLQLLLGPLNLFTLPWHAVTWPFVLVILTGVALALSALFLLWREVKTRDVTPGRYFIPIAAILSLTVVFMATGRHLYRVFALKPFEKKLEQNTREYQKHLKEFLRNGRPNSQNLPADK